MKNQQQAVYDAEDLTRFATRLPDLDSCRQYVSAIRERDFWRDLIGESLLFVETRYTPARHSHCETKPENSWCCLWLTSEGYNTRTILHELAHAIARVLHGSQSHDPWWCRVYLELVSMVAGPDAYVQLRDAFSARGVEVAGEGIVFRRKDVTAL